MTTASTDSAAGGPTERGPTERGPTDRGPTLRQFRAMGGPAELRATNAPVDLINHAFNLAQSEIARLESRYSRYLDASVVTAINKSAGSGSPVNVDTETSALLNYADTLWQQSDGLFDITSGVLRHVWDFSASQPPETGAIDECLTLVGWDHVEWNGASILLPIPGMELDFGGIVKEYACDAAAGILRREGLDHALVDLAGDLACTGPEQPASPWRIGISQPADPDAAMATIGLERGGLATSGDYHRCIHWQGQRYSHILDPRSGWPTQGLVSVTVKTDQCLVAGSSSTLAMLMGGEAGLNWLRSQDFQWLAVDDAGDIHGTIYETT